MYINNGVFSIMITNDEVRVKLLGNPNYAK